jgi:DNA polymerase elongation subunit (family B)
MNLNFILDQCLVFDIETYAQDNYGREINIQTHFDDYVAKAKCKFIGFYSYKYKKEYYFDVEKSFYKIKQLIAEHKFLIGYNNEEFDFPIIVNNGLIDDIKKFIQVDCMKIICASSFKDRNGYKYKGRGDLMGYKFKNNSLECVAQTLDVEFKKGKIDYKIFAKECHTEQEKNEILQYLRNDVMATKGIFDRLFSYWNPFISMLKYEDITNLSWIKSSIASLIYKSACNVLGVEATYSEHIEDTDKEEMGGNVFTPKYEEARGVWYIDFTSLYPHIFYMFNLFAEIKEDYPVKKWHGNEIFKVRGYYDNTYQHPLCIEVQKKLKERIELKKQDETNPNIYTLKIWLNGLYGVVRSAIFEKVHKPNAGWDCCWLGQQIQDYTKTRLENLGFETIYGDTDSLHVIANKNEYNNEEYVKKCLKTIITEILNNVPYPSETFDIKIENYLKYVLYPFSEQPIVDETTGKNIKNGNRLVKERKGKKKNYAYIYEKDGQNKIEIVGLPLKKDNATPLGYKIFEEILKPKILKEEKAKFTKEFIDNIIEGYLKQDGILELFATEYKIKPFNTYKTASIQAQASNIYFNGGSGVIHLIKNNKIGQVGVGAKYCTIDEAKQNNLSINDLDLEKLYNELEPFIIYQPEIKTIKKQKVIQEVK